MCPGDPTVDRKKRGRRRLRGSPPGGGASRLGGGGRRTNSRFAPANADERASVARLLTRPQVRSLASASAMARMPVAMGAVALVIFVHAQTGSFGSAGAVTAAYTLAFAIAGPILARLVDRRGVRAILLPAASLASLALLSIAVLGEMGAPVVALIGASAVAGAAAPPISGVLRHAWPSIFDEEELPTAYLFDSILIETVFIGGQIVIGVLAAALDPAAPIIFGAVVGFIGTAWFVSLPAITAMKPSPPHHHTRAGALASPVIVLLVVTGAPIGFSFGAFDVALPAFAASHGSSAMGGLFTALLGVGSVVGALVYGAFGTRLGDLRQACVRLAIAQPLVCLPLLLAPSPLLLIAPAILAGTYVAPVLTVRSRIAQISMPPGTGTETFTWLLLALMAGVSAGSLTAGPAVEASGWRLGVAVGIALPVLALPLLIGRQKLLPRA
ncbi:MAG: MFS transporter [Solirubrobacterales bacterium]